MTVFAWISGCAAPTLSDEERAFFAESQPWGLILFGRNVDGPRQVAELAAAFRAAVGRADAPVLIDQEGGRVQRLRPPHWPRYPAAAAYRISRDPEAAARLGGRLIADDLHRLGITIDCAPVLDHPVPGSHDVIGNRAFGTDVDGIVRLGRAFAEGLLAGGILPVIKHMPGHGRAGVDSHLSLPMVDAARESLETEDFEPCRRLADLPVGMTAHVVYTALDRDRPATTSPSVIGDVIRGAIGFDGLLLSDDLSMEALRGSLGERAAAAREAGCDILLHCNGKLAEARAVAAEARPIAGATERRIETALRFLQTPEPLDREAAEAEFAGLTGSPAAA